MIEEEEYIIKVLLFFLVKYEKKTRYNIHKLYIMNTTHFIREQKNIKDLDRQRGSKYLEKSLKYLICPICI